MEDLEELRKLIKKYKSLPTLVEGKKDVLSLKKLGFKKVKTVQKPLYQIIDEVNVKEVQILTDLDKEGKRIYSQLRHELQRNGVKINNSLRNELSKTKVKTIESLYKYLKKREIKHGRPDL